MWTNTRKRGGDGILRWLHLLEPYHHQGHQLFTDRYYSSIPLAQALHDNETACDYLCRKLCTKHHNRGFFLALHVRAIRWTMRAGWGNVENWWLVPSSVSAPVYRSTLRRYPLLLSAREKALMPHFTGFLGIYCFLANRPRKRSMVSSTARLRCGA